LLGGLAARPRHCAAPAFWAAATAGLVVAAIILCSYLAWMFAARQARLQPAPVSPGAAPG
jgi:hypothetical protein